ALKKSQLALGRRSDHYHDAKAELEKVRETGAAPELVEAARAVLKLIDDHLLRITQLELSYAGMAEIVALVERLRELVKEEQGTDNGNA
ncbi:MAG: hypothetical protein ACYTAO_21320, partial [Planctomycetota bacterium]